MNWVSRNKKLNKEYMQNKKKIAIILPYKEKFSNSKAGSAAIWVKDFNQKSKFKNISHIYGQLENIEDVIDKKNYINIKENFTSRFYSKNKYYIEQFNKFNNRFCYSIIEIHNRPSYINFINLKNNTKIILIIHNNPQTLKGSRTSKERLDILNKCQKILFVSNWVKSKFFEHLNINNHPKCEVIYPSINPISKLPKKEKIILFVGKLNKSKGFHLFGKSIIKVLNANKDWKSIVIGDESREKYSFKHHRLTYKGWLSHKETLKYYTKASIAIIPSAWEEPFGRTSLEASSRGCISIISNKGGLTETTKYKITLKEVNSYEITKSINNLIKNKKLQKKIQNQSVKDVLHKLKENTKKIDNIKDELLNRKKLNILKNKFLKIVHISNFGYKHFNRIYHISIARKISNGFIRNGHDVINLSNRDLTKSVRDFNDIKGKKFLNRMIVETFKNYNPNLIVLGHVNNIEMNTLHEMKEYNKNLKIVQWFEDSLSANGPDPYENRKKYTQYKNAIDQNFLTTHPKSLNFIKDKKVHHYLPIPVDKNIEKLEIYNNKNSINDLFFSMSHGVNRGTLKRNKTDERTNFIEKLINQNPQIIFDIYGYKNKEPIWAEDFYKAINLSKMGLNLTRGKPIKYYTSNRIASLIGNGLLTFIDKKTELNDFLDENEAIFYNDLNDLSNKLNYFKDNESLRIKYAKKGKKKYFKYFSSEIVANYITKKAFEEKIKNPLKWME